MLYSTACGLAFLAAAVMLALRGERKLAILAALMVPAWTIAAGLAGHQWVTVAVGTAVVAVMLTRWAGPCDRKRVAKVLGEKGRAIRARLTARWRSAPSPQRP
jgi:membrane protein implicated in regulation of membrane protease activity